jgi:hypothetical protein
MMLQLCHKTSYLMIQRQIKDYNPKSRFPWGISSLPSGNGSGGDSAGGSFDNNKILPKPEWEKDPTC